MLRLALLVAILLLPHGSSAQEAKDPTREQKLAALVFGEVLGVHVAELVKVQTKDGPMPLPKVPWKEIGKPLADRALRFIANPVSYRFDGSAFCFEPGLRIVISEQRRKVTLDVCLDCEKLSVVVDEQPPFAIDLSEVGLALYKSLHADFMAQKNIRH